MTFEDLQKKVKYIGDMEDELKDLEKDLTVLHSSKMKNKRGHISINGVSMDTALTTEELIEAYISKQKELEVDIAQEKELLNLQVKTQGVLK